MDPKTRAKEPSTFTHDAVSRCLAACDMSEHVRRCLAGGELIEYNWTLKGSDRRSLYQHRDLVAMLLEENPSGIFRKSTMEQGMQAWQTQHGQPLTKDRAETFLKDQAYNLFTLCNNVKVIRKSARSGTKLPAWLWDLCQLLEIEVKHGDDVDSPTEEYFGGEAVSNHF